MSALDGIPETPLDLELDEAELIEYLDAIFQEVREQQYNGRYHDRNGYYAHTAGSAACRELGHIADDGDWENLDAHEFGFDGDLLCVATSYGECCTECEGECFWTPAPRLWELVAA